jgi:adenine phosphoribosyltransferase
LNLTEDIKRTIRTVPDFPKSGIMFKDITPIFYNQELCTKIVDGFIEKMEIIPDAIVGIESRGFLFGQMMANKLNKPFVLIRKAGKLPYKKISYEYELEYGKSKIEMHEDALQKGWNVLIHDDLLATGGTAEAAAHLVNMVGAKVCGYNFVIGLDFLNGKEKLINHSKNIICLVNY